ncbi:protein ALP1-like [Temnothorax curvispinosus]|uniref:Protein ALP1-like n=1 Tax=Temnothorax curvispinosus TaxID=300111 RepID=A0A6J1R8G3_9HYME|nr:protein ALP1-like [Temnothorax curvispinosus]
MAAADAEYKFTWVDIGDYGSMSDGDVWAESALGSALEDGSLDLPLSCFLPNTNIMFPHFFVGDEAFPLKTYMMRPYPKKDLSGPERIFNYRLSRARRVVENSFGILTTKWRVLRRSLCCSPDNAEVIVKALICLHNFLLTKEGGVGGRYCPRGLLDHEVNGIVEPGAWRNENNSPHIQELHRTGSNNAGRAIINLRNVLRDYVNSDEGAVEWQWDQAFHNINMNLN